MEAPWQNIIRKLDEESTIEDFPRAQVPAPASFWPSFGLEEVNDTPDEERQVVVCKPWYQVLQSQETTWYGTGR